MAQTSWLRRLVDRLRQPTPLPRVSNDVEVVSSFIANRPVPPDEFDRRKLVDEGYRRNVIVYVCVNEIAQSAAAPRYLLRDRKTQQEVTEHPLLDVFARPAADLSWYALIERLLIHQQTTGTGYLHKGRTAGGQLVQLKPLRPERVQPVPDRQGNVVRYDYKIEGEATQPIEPQDVAPFALPDPLNDFHGLAPLSVAAIFGDIDTAAAMYLRDFFANGAMPMGLLKFKTPRVAREDRLRVQAEWTEQYGTGREVDPRRPTQWHNVGVIGGDVEYQPLALEPAHLRLDSVWGMTESRLCATFGVPPSIVAAKIGLQYNTYSNAREARRSFWTETLVPIYRRLGDGITRHVVAEVDDRLEFFFDLEGIPELQEDLNQRAERATKMFLGSVASLNEARKLADLEEVKQDYFFKPSTGTLVRREDVESGKVTEAADAARTAIAEGGGPKGLLPPKPKPGEEPPPEDEGGGAEGQSARPFGLGEMPEGREREILRAAASLERGFSEAVREAVEASDEEALAAALARGDWRGGQKFVAVDRFVSRYSAELDRHLREQAEAALAMHYRHHAGDGRETHALAPKWMDRIVSRVRSEARRLDREVRDVVRTEILKVIHGEARAVSPASILRSIGLSERQRATVERARTRLLEEGKLKGKALEKDLDRLRVKLLRERAERIAAYETRLAHTLGQAAAWERLLAEGKLRGGRRHWHKMWQVHETENTCGVCMDLDGEEAPLDGLFDGEFYGPPEPHPNCACGLVLVPASGRATAPPPEEAS